MIQKLKVYGIKDNLVNWIESVLHERTFNVSINGNISQSKAAVSRVPEGSVLGPILFLIYVNDLPDIITKTRLVTSGGSITKGNATVVLNTNGYNKKVNIFLVVHTWR